MSTEFIAHHEDGICRPLVLSSDTGGLIAITASVGINGRNFAEDVRVIQRALNDVPPDQGKPAPLLVVDGICGEKTKKAIQLFQLKHFGWKGADGRVDPDKQTIAKLNELVGGSSVLAADFGALQIAANSIGRIARVKGLLDRSFSCLRAAKKNLLSALSVVDKADPPGFQVGLSRAERMLLANRHFDVDTYPKSTREGVLRQILNTFDMMDSVFARPGGLWGVAIFELDPLDLSVTAYTVAQGFHRPGKTIIALGKRIRADSIYLCKKLDTKTDDVCVLVVIHELAHFVGFPGRITDFGQGWFDEPQMKKLVPSQKLFNAMNYNNFAFDARHGRKPSGL